MSLELGRVVKEQWEEVVKANQDYPEHKMLKIPLTPFEIDSKSIYLFLKHFSMFLNENPNLLTMVHDGEKVLRAYAEGTDCGVYTSLIKIELDGWEKGLPLHDVKAVFDRVKPVAKERTDVDVGLLKFAHVDFFKEFYPVFDKKSSNLESICHMYDCTRKVVDQGLIAFYPEPKLFKFLRETKDIQLDPGFLKEKIKKWLPNRNYGVLIRTGDGLIGLVISKHDENIYVEFPRKEVDELGDGNIKSLTTLYRQRLDLNLAFGLEADDLKDAIIEISDYSLKDKELIDVKSEYLEDYGKNFYISVNSFLDNLLTTSIKHKPSWLFKKLGYKIQKWMFD